MRPRSLVVLLCSSSLLPFGSCGGEPTKTAAPTTGALGGASAPTSIRSGPLSIAAVAAARPVTTTDERNHLVYELLFQNLGTASVQIANVQVTERAHGHRVLASYRDEALAAILEGSDPTIGGIPPGGLAAAFIDLALAPDGREPRQLAHLITIEQGATQLELPGPAVPVVDDGPLTLGPPLRGPNLLDLSGCCKGDHTRALLPVDGQVALAQRYAIDFVRLTEEGNFSGDPTRNESYFVFGAEVIAAGSGRIIEVVDGMAENIPTQPLPPFTLETAAGNHVVEALDDGRFALYAHMQPGSLRVQPGTRVRRGQVLGLVGNTGNSFQPHLHFHVTDGPSPLGSNGVPYVFDRFDLIATIDLTVPDPDVVFVPPSQARRRRLPMSGDVVTFP